jgi:pyruvate dehydrogenase E2 component (dihydrolipoamide acetyltransferase)
MPIEMKMPRLSDTMEQGTVVRWAVKPGQKVKSGDVVADIETDKATMELQTFDDGTVADLAVAEGSTVKVGTIILRLAEAGESIEAAKAGAPSAAAAPAPAAATKAAGSTTITERHGVITAAPAPAPTNGSHAHASSGERVFASPLARKIAGETGVNLAGIQGSGPSGRIIRRDVEAALAGGAVARAPIAPAKSHAAPAPMPMAGATLAARSLPLSNMRATIANRLVQSKTTIPHYQVTASVRMDPLLALRAQLNDQLASQGVKLSVNDFLVRACALAMHTHPHVNSRWNDHGPAIDLVGEVNIGVAIALPLNERGEGGGLVVATLRSADRLGLRQISSETKRLGDKARSKGLSIEEMSDSTFTISNLGMFGVEHFTAIINPPNAAILAVGAAVEKPVVDTDPKTGEKRIVVGHEMQMTMSSDHRIIDGAMAAQYLATVKKLLEAPATLLV